MILVLGIIVIIGIWLAQSKINFDIPSFFHPSLPLDRGVFGVYCFTGKQGTGKTYSLNKFIRKHAKGKKIYSNLTLKNIEYTHLNSLEELLALRNETDCYIIYDEIFTLMSKSKKISEIMSDEFLPQQRKVHNIFLTTAQEWLELPIPFRRFVRVQVHCNTRPLGKWGGILTETYYDATQMVWDNLQNEYIAPLITTKISKYEKRFMQSYDTFERINRLK